MKNSHINKEKAIEELNSMLIGHEAKVYSVPNAMVGTR